MDIATTAPRAFVVGSTVQFKIEESDYPAPTWSAELALVSSSSAVTYAGTDNGDGAHLFTLSATDTADLVAGIYRYQINVAMAAVRHTIRQGSIEALTNYAAVTGGHDDRTSPAQLYDAIDATMNRKATHDQSSLAVGGRSLSRYTWAELSEMRGYYAHRMTDEERISRGFAPYGVKTVRFTR